MSLNIFIAITDFTAENGATIVCPNTHQMSYKPDLSYLKSVSTPIEAKRGSVIIFDSTLYHCSGKNISGGDRVSLNHQFTRSYIKQQIDYVRAIGKNRIKKLPTRTQQLLGYYTRVPTSLDEFYQPLEKRLYQPKQV
jgi:ectoine hydroxylase-related dioxygenase (phytanoyl-CoA dioxygenase family)